MLGGGAFDFFYLSWISIKIIYFTFSIMASWIPEDIIRQDTTVPISRNAVYMILLDVEPLHDGKQAQQQLATVGQQQQAS